MTRMPVAVAGWVLIACGGCGPPAGGEPDARPTDAAPEAPFPAGVRDLANVLEPLRASGEMPALGAAIVERGQVVALGVVGVRALGHPPAAWWDDRWHLGSETKAMTATLTARLVERGVLAWDTPLPTLLPGVPMHAAYAAITPRQLLAHRAGLPTDIPAAIWNPLWMPGNVPAQRRWFAEQILALAPAQPIGTFAYANAGYMVLGAALEAVTGQPWEELLRDEVLAPLAMTSCGFGMPDGGSLDDPWGHRVEGGAVLPVMPGRGDDNPPALGPAGTVHCALSDWAKFIAAHVAGARGDTSYLGAASWTAQHTPLGDDYALGWGVTSRPWAGGTVFTHTGSNTMNFAVVWAAPAIDRAFLVVTNRGDAAAETDAVVAALINLPSP
jgi:D-alanyl-D-alanine carboxypeptidase